MWSHMQPATRSKNSGRHCMCEKMLLTRHSRKITGGTGIVRFHSESQWAVAVNQNAQKHKKMFFQPQAQATQFKERTKEGTVRKIRRIRSDKKNTAWLKQNKVEEVEGYTQMWQQHMLSYQITLDYRWAALFWHTTIPVPETCSMKQTWSSWRPSMLKFMALCCTPHHKHPNLCG